MNGVRPEGGRLLLALGSPGDRADDMVAALGAIGARGADRVMIGGEWKVIDCNPVGIDVERLRAEHGALARAFL
jgi:cyanophycin synthetase